MQYDNVGWLSVWLTMNLARNHTLDCVIHQHVGEPTHLSLSTAGKYAGSSVLQRAIPDANLTCGIFLRRCGEVLSDSGRLVVLKRSFTVSLRLLDVLSGFWSGVVVLVLLVLFLFCSCFWTSSLLRISQLSNSSRSVDRPCQELDRHSLQKKSKWRSLDPQSESSPC